MNSGTLVFSDMYLVEIDPTLIGTIFDWIRDNFEDQILSIDLNRSTSFIKCKSALFESDGLYYTVMHFKDTEKFSLVKYDTPYDV